jgi:hypothetical protein
MASAFGADSRFSPSPQVRSCNHPTDLGRTRTRRGTRLLDGITTARARSACRPGGEPCSIGSDQGTGDAPATLWVAGDATQAEVCRRCNRTKSCSR